MVINIIFIFIIICMIWVMSVFFRGKTMWQVIGSIVGGTGLLGFAILFMIIVELLKDVLSE